MKRGLVTLDPAEVAVAEYHGRVAALQRRLQQDGLAAALIYGDVYRSGDISYLTNLCVYWNEGLLLVPAGGEPVLLTKLSARTHPWMQASSTLRDLRSGPNPVDLLVRALAEQAPGTLGLVEQGWWPAPLLAELQSKLSDWSVTDLGPVVKAARRRPSPAEVQLLRRSAAVGAEAVVAAARAGQSPPQRAGLVERDARKAGVEDILVWSDTGPDGSNALEALPEWRGYWTRAARTLLAAGGAGTAGAAGAAGAAGDGRGWAGALTAAWAAALASLRTGVSRAEVAAAVAPHLRELAPGTAWELDLVDHTELETRGDYRLPDDVDAPVPDGSVAALSLMLHFADGTRAAAADTFWFWSDGVERLTAALPAAPIWTP